MCWEFELRRRRSDEIEEPDRVEPVSERGVEAPAEQVEEPDVAEEREPELVGS